MNPRHLPLIALPSLVAAALPAQAFDVTDQFSINGILAPTGQCQSVDVLRPAESYNDDGALDSFDDECRGGMPFQVELSYHPDASNEFFAKFGWAVDNGLNEASPWMLAPWAADLEDEVKDINGRNRDHLLTAWYKYTHALGAEDSLGATIGIIDSTDYIDGNAFANDEYTQFMNEAFVNAGNHNLPSYDGGAALELSVGDWTLNGLGMNIGENDAGDNYNFWGVEAGYHPQTALGAGNYRLTLSGTSSAFLNPAGDKKESLLSYGLSFDQEFGDIVGGFLRLTWQEEDAAVDYEALYSGGLNFSGKAWGREEDNIGIGYAYLDGSNGDIVETQVVEAYYRAALNQYAAISADVQYMEDDIDRIDPRQDNPEGWIFGLRLTAEF